MRGSVGFEGNGSAPICLGESVGLSGSSVSFFDCCAD
jgi:hypothetical protein